jgi:hypothetical protein
VLVILFRGKWDRSYIRRSFDQGRLDRCESQSVLFFPLPDSRVDSFHAEPNTLPPRPANQTSIPALLTALQSEYDSIMLESLEIKKSHQSSRCVEKVDIAASLLITGQARAGQRIVSRGCSDKGDCETYEREG